MAVVLPKAGLLHFAHMAQTWTPRESSGCVGVRGTESASPASQASAHSGIARSVLLAEEQPCMFQVICKILIMPMRRATLPGFQPGTQCTASSGAKGYCGSAPSVEPSPQSNERSFNVAFARCLCETLAEHRAKLKVMYSPGNSDKSL